MSGKGEGNGLRKPGLISGFILALASLLVLGVVTTRLFIDDGSGEFRGQERKAADRALSEARTCLDDPLSFLIKQMRVVDVRRDGEGRFHVLLRRYGLFGVRTGAISRRDGSVHCRLPSNYGTDV